MALVQAQALQMEPVGRVAQRQTVLETLSILAALAALALRLERRAAVEAGVVLDRPVMVAPLTQLQKLVAQVLREPQAEHLAAVRVV